MSINSVQPGHLFCFGLGYSASRLAARLAARGWAVSGTSRSNEQATAGRALGYAMHVFDGTAGAEAACFDGVSHILISVPCFRCSEILINSNILTLSSKIDRVI